LTAEGVDRLATFERLTQQLMDEVLAVPADALDWKPGPDTNSIWAISIHALSACRHWLVAVVAREPNPRDRESEFRATGSDNEELIQAGKRWIADARRLLPGMDGAYLEAPCDLMRTTGIMFPTTDTISNRMALLHSLEHLGIHVGHVQLTAQLWRLQAGVGQKVRPSG
jgi:DinB superfamily